MSVNKILNARRFLRLEANFFCSFGRNLDTLGSLSSWHGYFYEVGEKQKAL